MCDRQNVSYNFMDEMLGSRCWQKTIKQLLRSQISPRFQKSCLENRAMILNRRKPPKTIWVTFFPRIWERLLGSSISPGEILWVITGYRAWAGGFTADPTQLYKHASRSLGSYKHCCGARLACVYGWVGSAVKPPAHTLHPVITS